MCLVVFAGGGVPEWCIGLLSGPKIPSCEPVRVRVERNSRERDSMMGIVYHGWRIQRTVTGLCVAEKKIRICPASGKVLLLIQERVEANVRASSWRDSGVVQF